VTTNPRTDRFRTQRTSVDCHPPYALFTSKSVQQGTVIRRKARDIERFAGMERFLREIHRRGFQVAENSGQIVIFCNRAPVRWLTSPLAAGILAGFRRAGSAPVIRA